MIYSIFLQTNVTDITFRIMDVVLIIGGVISMLTTFFVLKQKSEKNTDKITDLMEDVIKLEAKIVKFEDGSADFRKGIFAKLDKQNEEIHKLGLSLEGVLSKLNNK